MNHSFGWLLDKDIREFTRRLEFFLVFAGYIYCQEWANPRRRRRHQESRGDRG